MIPAQRIIVIGGGRPGWVPQGASYYADFTAARYWNGNRTNFATATDFTRNSVGWADNLAGVWSSFATDVARINDKGLLIEPARTNYLPVFAAPGFTSFQDITVGDGTTTGPLGGLGKTLSDFVNGNSAAGVATSGATVLATQTYVGSIWLRGSGLVRLRMARSGGGTFEATVGNDITLSSTFTRHELAHTYANNQDEARLDVIGGFASTASSCEVYGGQVELAASRSSPIMTTSAALERAADALTLHLGSETLDLTFTFDDDSTQAVAGQTGDYAVPTNLDRAIIKSVVAVPE